MKKLILFSFLCLIPKLALADAQQAFLECSLTWTPIIPCSDASYDAAPVITYKIQKPKKGSKKYHVEREETYSTHYCGSNVFSQAKHKIRRSKYKPFQNANKYVFESLTVYKKKGAKILEAEMAPFGRNIPTGSCNIK